MSFGQTRRTETRRPETRRPEMRGFESAEAASARKRARYLEGVKEIDPRDYEVLRRFVTDHGKIVPSRFTGATPKQQRQISRAIRRARVMGLLR